MEFLRQHRKVIIVIISLSFLAWTLGMMLLPLFLK